MKERWRAIANLLEEEFDIEVQPSYEGWGAGYDPRYLPLLEMWSRGEVEEVPPAVKRPKGVVFSITDFFRRGDDFAINSVRHEIAYLLSTHFPNWRFGQREVFRAGYVPSSFLVLFAVLENLKADTLIVESNPSAVFSLKERYREILRNIRSVYPHHQLATALIRRWMDEATELSQDVDRYLKSLERSMYEYIHETDPQASYDIVMEDMWPKFRALVDAAKDLNYIDLLIEEAKGKRREDAHRGRIMTDILRKLPERLRETVYRYRDGGSSDVPVSERKEVLKALNSLPDWMKDYIRQMSYLDMLEKDMAFLRHFLPKTLEVDI